MKGVMEKENKDDFCGIWWQYPPLRNGLIAGMVAGSGFVLVHLKLIQESMEIFFYLFSISIGGYYWIREGLKELFSEREVGIDILMLAAAAGSAILGLWDESAFLVFLYATAEGLEGYTYARTRSAIRSLLSLAHKEAHLLKEDREILIPAEELKPGDRFQVRPGELIPTDGIIRSGISNLDESPVTGESIPVNKGPGMKVFAGAMNGQGALVVEVTKTFSDNSLSKMIHLVEEAQEQKGKAQQWIDRFGRRYSPMVLVIAILMIVVPWLFGGSLSEWSLRGVVFLVAAAPCALIMSMPVAMAVGIGSAGKRGILVKGGIHLEHLGKIRVVTFDKTGTLTHGKPTVTDMIPLQGSIIELLSLAAGLEHFSEHPLGKAIITLTESEGLTPAKIDSFEALTGSGAKGDFEGVTWYIGNQDLFQGLGISLDPVKGYLERFQKEGKTVVLLGKKDYLRGLIALQDQIRDETSETITLLHEMGIRTVMLTGDNIKTAEAVALDLGIDDVRAELRPDEKVQAVKELEALYGPVLMVGDGINDAPALAAATCGAAMGAAGTDAAIETADVALMADDIGKVVEALQLGRKAWKISRQNIVFSLIVLTILIPMAVGGFLSVVAAVFFHEISELLAVANGLRVAQFS